MQTPTPGERKTPDAAAASGPLHHTTDALPTLSGRMVQASARQLHHRPDASAVVYLTVPGALPDTGRCLPLDAHVARRLAAHLLDCAAMVDRHNNGFTSQTEREALDQAISGLVGLS